MPFYFVMPVVQASVGPNNQMVNVPSHFTDILQPNKISFSCMPYGLDLVCVLTVNDAATAAQLAQQADTYAFPADLTSAAQDADIATLVVYLDNANIPSTQLISGMQFSDILQIVAELMLANQALCGVTGVPTFSSEVTPDTPIGSSGAATLVPTAQLSIKSPGNSVGVGGTAASAPAAPTSNGPYDFSQLDPNATIGDSLILLSQQPTNAPILSTF